MVHTFWWHHQKWSCSKSLFLLEMFTYACFLNLVFHLNHFLYSHILILTLPVPYLCLLKQFILYLVLSFCHFASSCLHFGGYCFVFLFVLSLLLSFFFWNTRLKYFFSIVWRWKILNVNHRPIVKTVNSILKINLWTISLIAHLSNIHNISCPPLNQ